MRLRQRFRISLAISLGTTLLLAMVLGLSLRESKRALDAEDVAQMLQRQILERGIVRDEYLLHREERAKVQWRTKTVQLEDLLRRAAAVFDGAEERAMLAEMVAIGARSESLFDEIVGLPDESVLETRELAASVALRERLTNSLLLNYHDFYSRANQLVASASRRAQSNRDRTLLALLTMIGAVLTITVVNGILINRLLEKRISRLRDGAEHLAAGDLKTRVAIEGDDELANLGRAFDAMAAELQKTSTILEARVSQVASLNDELQQQVAQLAISNKELEAFSYSVSHDLRAPLRHVHSFVELLLEHAPGNLDAKSRHYLQVISAAAKKMGVLIDDLLAFSRMSRAEMMLRPVSFHSLVENVVRDFTAETAGRKIVWDIAALPEVTGDESMLRQVWSNLIGNALKFSRSRSPARIAIGAVADGSRNISFYVKDNGEGFDMKHVGMLFGAFRRLHAADEFQGTGIGLANVHRIVLRHGGKVWAEGIPGEGATFWFSLPRKEGES